MDKHRFKVENPRPRRAGPRPHRRTTEFVAFLLAHPREWCLYTDDAKSLGTGYDLKTRVGATVPGGVEVTQRGPAGGPYSVYVRTLA